MAINFFVESIYCLDGTTSYCIYRSYSDIHVMKIYNFVEASDTYLSFLTIYNIKGEDFSFSILDLELVNLLFNCNMPTYKPPCLIWIQVSNWSNNLVELISLFFKDDDISSITLSQGNCETSFLLGTSVDGETKYVACNSRPCSLHM